MRIVTCVRCLLFVVVVLVMSATSFSQVSFSITFGPPPLPVYEQPLCPGEGYIWTPGYWAFDYDYDDYYWVPGTWVLAPQVGYFWTPAYWAWGGNRFVFYEGYWGPQVGFYGGIDYGYGYFGNGYEGGRWDRGRFFYNRAVNNVNVTVIHNVYNTTVINRTTVNRVSYNGGDGGINARPTREQEAAAHERHLPPVAVQTQHMQAARTDREQHASVNRGKPAIAASPRPADSKDRVPAKEAGGPYNPPANRGEGNRGNRQDAQRPENDQQGQGQRSENNNNNDRPGNVIHPKDLPRSDRPPSRNSGDAKQDQRYQRDQEKLMRQQDQERQKLQQRQDQEHQKMERQKADDARQQQLEQRHQQQTRQLEQRQSQQQQQWDQKHQPKNRDQRPPK